MNVPWIVLTMLAIAAFAYFEARAFRHPDRQNSLSRWIYDLGARWPLSIYIMGMFSGGLAVHFFWHWCPPGSIQLGNLDPMKAVQYGFDGIHSYAVILIGGN